jgi:hypothetical protein
MRKPIAAVVGVVAALGLIGLSAMPAASADLLPNGLHVACVKDPGTQDIVQRGPTAQRADDQTGVDVTSWTITIGAAVRRRGERADGFAGRGVRLRAAAARATAQLSKVRR